MTPEEQKALDKSLLREWTRKSSAVSCCKFCSAVTDDATAAIKPRAEVAEAIRAVLSAQSAPVARKETAEPAGVPCVEVSATVSMPERQPSGLC